VTTPSDASIPARLVALAAQVAGQINAEFAPLLTAKQALRSELSAAGEIQTFAQNPTDLPTSMCAVDGARIREQMYAVDMLYAVATAKDARFTTEHPPVTPQVWARPMRHMDGTEAVVQTAMGALEVSVAASVPHQVVALDGSLLTPLLALQSGLRAKSSKVKDAAAEILLDPAIAPLDALGALLDRPAGTLLALTKSDSATQFTAAYKTRFGINAQVADRILATQLLKPGEVLAPRVMTELAHHQTLGEMRGAAPVRAAAARLDELVTRIATMAAAGKVHTTYFKPYGAHTVVRFEFLTDTADPAEALAAAVRWAGILNADTNAPHLMEPFCQYAVDREVKTISSGAKALKNQMLSQLPPAQAAAYRTLLAEGYRT
jgi:hypothetical protein